MMKASRTRKVRTPKSSYKPKVTGTNNRIMATKSRLAKRGVTLPTPNNGYRVVSADELKTLWDKSLVVSVDAEWRNVTEAHTVGKTTSDYHHARFLSSQFSWTEDGRLKVLVLWHEDHPLPNSVDIPDCDELMIHLCNPEELNPLKLGMMGKHTKLSVLMFYSPHDVRSLVGNDVWLPWLIGEDGLKYFSSFKGFAGSVSKKRKLNGELKSSEYGTLKLIDVIGTCTAGMSLDAFHESVGVHSPYKSLSDNWDKSKMEVWMKEDPKTFLQYAVGDVLFLELAVGLRAQQLNEIVEESLGFNPEFVEPWKKPVENQTRLPMSSGALVSTVFEMWLEKDPTYNRVLKALLPFTCYTTTKGQTLFNNTVLSVLSNGEPKPHKGLAINNYDPNHPLTKLPSRDGYAYGEDPLDYFHPISLNSIPAIVYKHQGANSTAVLNAIVYGGRCVNERPNQTRIEKVLDIDLNSCYGSALVGFTYPIGFPRVHKHASSDLKRLKLGPFLKKYGDELVDDCYQIVVSGELSFKQDLVASKLGVDERKIIRTVVNKETGDDGDTGLDEDALGRTVERSHIPGDMVFLTKEIVHGAITSDILNTIRRVATDREKSEWMNLTVETAIYYAKSDMCTDIDVFEKACDIEVTYNKDAVMKTPQVWYPCQLKDFVGNFVNTRKSLKRAVQTKGDANDLKQNGIKLFINTVYGCMASPYFRMGSTLIANNITAKARLGAWMMAKALGSVQSITDGGMYSAWGVRTITKGHEGRKPGFNVLADYDETNSHRGIATGPIELGEYTLDFPRLKEELHKGDKDFTNWFEGKVLDHINKFWGNYGLKLPFDIEHKYENTGDYASYYGSADYLIVGSKSKKHREFNGVKYPYTFKCRGVKDFNGMPHFKEVWLWVLAGVCSIEDLVFNEAGELEQKTSKVHKLIQVQQWQANFLEYIRNGIYPGDGVDTLQIWRPNENHHLCETEAEYKKRAEAYSKQVRKHQKELDTLGYIGRQFGLTKHDAESRRGVLGTSYPELYKEVFENT